MLPLQAAALMSRIRLPLTLSILRLTLAAISLGNPATAQDAKPELTLATAHSRSARDPLVIPEENLLFSVDHYGEVKVWDLSSGKVLKDIAMPNGVQAPAYLRNRKWVALAANDGVRLYRVEDLSLVAHIQGKNIETLAYDPVSGRLFCTSPSPQGLRLLELDLDHRTLVLRTTVPNPPYEPTIGGVPQLTASRITVMDDGRLLANLSHGAVIFDPQNWAQFERRPEENRIFARGRAGEIIATFKAQKLEILDGRTLAPRRAALVPEPQRSSWVPLKFAGVLPEPQEEKLVFRGDKSILIVDPESLAVIRTLDTGKDLGAVPFDLYELVPLGGADWLMSSGSNLHRVNLHTRRVTLTYGTHTYQARQITTAPTGFNFYLSSGLNRNSRLVELTRDGVTLSEYAESPQHVEFSPDGQHVAFQHTLERALRVSKAHEFPHQSRTLTATKRVPLPELANFKFSPDGRRIAVLSHNSTHIYDAETAALLFEAPPSRTANPTWTRGFGAFSPDASTFVTLVGDRDARDLPARYLRAFDLTTGTQRWQLYGGNYPLHYTPDGSELYAINPDHRLLVRIDSQTGEVKGTQPLPGFETVRSGFHRWCVSADGSRLLVHGGSQISVFSLPQGEVLSSHPLGHSLEDVAFFPRSDFYVTLSTDNRVRFWKTGQTAALAALTILSDGREWCLHTPDFQFQASPRAMREVYFVKGRAVIPIESLFEQFFTPGLAPRLFAGEKLQPPIDIAKIKVPPTVRVALEAGTRGLSVEDDVAVVKSAAAEATISVEAVSTQEAIAEIRLYQNDKLVQTTVRGLVVEDDPDARVEKRTFPLTLLPGENTFRAVAINAQRVESLPAELVVKYAPPAAAAVSTTGDAGAGLQLHLVVVGVNKYRNPRFNLNYAVADASALRDRVQQRAATIFSRINTHMLFDAQVTKRGITETLQKVAAHAGPRDVLLFYYAGHGVMSGEAQPKFYLVPHDLTQMYGADEKLATQALSSTELQELSRQIPAQKQLFILDACQSAGALEGVAARGAAEQKAIAQLARSSGTHWLTATGSEQFASEFEQLGHGAFTYVLLQGLDGRADSGDGRVSVKELSAYLETEVPEVTQKHKGTPQFPSSYSFGQDFPIGLIAK